MRDFFFMVQEQTSKLILNNIYQKTLYLVPAGTKHGVTNKTNNLVDLVPWYKTRRFFLSLF
jgi:hypothetical protein